MRDQYVVIIDDHGSEINMLVTAFNKTDAVNAAVKIHLDARCGDGDCEAVPTFKVVSVEACSADTNKEVLL